MIIVKKGTKKNDNLLRSTLSWEGAELEDVYGSASVFKHRAMKACKEEFNRDPHGENFHICGHNQMKFSVAWDTRYEGRPAVRKITADNDYMILK